MDNKSIQQKGRFLRTLLPLYFSDKSIGSYAKYTTCDDITYLPNLI